MVLAAALTLVLHTQMYAHRSPVQSNGLKFIDTIVGTGAEAKSGDTVTVSYRGSLTTGTVFDESKGKGPFVFTVGAGEVIKGWDEGLIGMKKGGKRILSIPPSLGYGDRDMKVIPPNSTLIFEIELLRVDKKGATAVIEIEEIVEGQGKAAAIGDTLDVHYTGTFLDGKKFDSSKDRDQTFPVKLGTTGIIKGFEQGLIGMKKGGKRKVTIPYELAYGADGRPPVIPPKSTLVFELEVVDIK